MKRMSLEGSFEFYIARPRKTWFGYGKEIWEPLEYQSYRGPSAPTGSSSVLMTYNDSHRITFLHCWTTSKEETEREFKSLVDGVILNEDIEKESRLHGDVAV